MPLPDPTPENVDKVKGLLKATDLDAGKRASMEKWLSDSLSHGDNQVNPKAAQNQREMMDINGDDYSPTLAVVSASGKRSLFAEPEHAPADPKGEVQYWNEPPVAEARKAGVPFEEYADKKWQEARAAAEASGTPLIRDKYVVPTTLMGKAKKAARSVSREAPSIMDAAAAGADNAYTAGLLHRGLADAADATGLDKGLAEGFDAAEEEHPGVAGISSLLATLGGGGISGAIAKKASQLFGVGATAGKAASSMLPQMARGLGAGATTAVAQGTAEDAAKAADQFARGKDVTAFDDSLSRDSVRAFLGGGVGAIASAAGARAAQHRDSEYSPEAPDIRRVEKAGGALKFMSPNGVEAPPAAKSIYDLANTGGPGIPIGSHPEEVAAKLAEPLVSKGAGDYYAESTAPAEKLVKDYFASSVAQHQVQPKRFLKALQNIFQARTYEEDQLGTPYTNSEEFKDKIRRLAIVSRPMANYEAIENIRGKDGIIMVPLAQARKMGFDVSPPEVNGLGVPMPAPPAAPVAPPRGGGLVSAPGALPDTVVPGDGTMEVSTGELMPGSGRDTIPSPPPSPTGVSGPADSSLARWIEEKSGTTIRDSGPADTPTLASPGGGPVTPARPTPKGDGKLYVVVTPRKLTAEKFDEVVHGLDKAARAASKTASPDRAHALLQRAIREDRDQFPWPSELGPEPTAKITERDSEGHEVEVALRGWSALHQTYHKALTEAENRLAATGLTPESLGTNAGERAVKNSLMSRGMKGSLEAEVAQDALATTPQGRQALANLDILNATQRLRGKASPIGGGKLREIRSLDFRADPLYRWIATRGGPATEAGIATATEEPPKDDRAIIKALLQSHGIGQR